MAVILVMMIIVMVAVMLLAMLVIKSAVLMLKTRFITVALRLLKKCDHNQPGCLVFEEARYERSCVRRLTLMGGNGSQGTKVCLVL